MLIGKGSGSWKQHLILGSAVFLLALLGAVAADFYLQLQQSRQWKPEVALPAPGESKPAPNQPGKMPHPTAEFAPLLTLQPLGEGAPFHLSGYRHVKPVVLVFGSFTCDLFHAQLAELGRLYHRHKEHAAFAFIVVQEAGHKIPGYEFLLEEPDAQTLKDSVRQRRDCLGKALASSGLPLPTYLDMPSHHACQAYRAWPRRLVVVDCDGRIAHDFGLGLARPWDLAYLDKVLDQQCAPPAH